LIRAVAASADVGHAVRGGSGRNRTNNKTFLQLQSITAAGSHVLQLKIRGATRPDAGIATRITGRCSGGAPQNGPSLFKLSPLQEDWITAIRN